MQEEIENRTVNLVVTSSKLSVRTLMDGMRRFINRMEEQSRLNRGTETRGKTDGPHGKQTVKQLIRHSNGLKQIPIQEESLKEFEKVLNRYGVDFAVMKENRAKSPRFLMFFKAKDEEVLKSVLEDCTRKQMEKSTDKRPSVLKLLSVMKEKVTAAPRKDRMREKDLSL